MQGSMATKITIRNTLEEIKSETQTNIVEVYKADSYEQYTATTQLKVLNSMDQIMVFANIVSTFIEYLDITVKSEMMTFR